MLIAAIAMELLPMSAPVPTASEPSILRPAIVAVPTASAYNLNPLHKELHFPRLYAFG
jgi:hypothetical protein